MTSTKTAISCPYCSIKLGFKVDSLHCLKPSDSVKLAVLPDGCGDNSENTNNNIIITTPFVRNGASKNPNMSYTIIKGCASSPESRANATNTSVLVKSRSSKSQVERKSIEKRTKSISANSTVTNATSHVCKNPPQLVRSQSYIISTHSASPTDNFMTVDAENLENYISKNASNEDVSMLGIDKVETASMYDSSSVSSDDWDRLSEVEIEHSKDEKLDQTQKRPLSPQASIILTHDVPKYRQDLYKDCFTLFMEKWFATRANR